MQQAQGAQRLEQMQFAPLEFAEHFVAGQHLGHLLCHGLCRAGEQHPQILDRRAHAGIVEIDEMRPVISPQHVACMTIAMQAQTTNVAGPGETLRHTLERLVGEAAPDGDQFGRDDLVRQQPVARGAAEGFRVEPFADMEGCAFPDPMDTRHQPPHPFQGARLAKFGRTAALARIDGETEAGMDEQRAPADRRRCDDRQFLRLQFGDEVMFFRDLRFAPTFRPVELDHHRRAILDADLPDPIFITAECQQPAIAPQADTFQRIEHALRRQPFKRRGGGRRGAHASQMQLAMRPVTSSRRKE